MIRLGALFSLLQQAQRDLLGRFGVVFPIIPIRDPFGSVSRHVVETIRTFSAILEPMPNTHAFGSAGNRRQGNRIAHPQAAIVICDIDKRLHVTPREPPLIRSPCGFFPFRLGRQSLAGPFAIGIRVFPIDADDRPIPGEVTASSSHEGGALCFVASRNFA